MVREHYKDHDSENVSSPLRIRIAREAARLLARKKVRNFHTARMRAMRWLSKERVSSRDVPTQEEVMKELDALSLSIDWNETPFASTADPTEFPDRHLNDSERWAIIFRPMLELSLIHI